ncbi:MAG TPA: alpha/beta hydrolase [Crenotrichaceae bacterium]|nr:alpha/beta hydrolase [Crenotrichaceae bacterium]
MHTGRFRSVTRMVCMVSVMLLVSACSPVTYKPGPSVQQPLLSETIYHTADGAELQLHQWMPDIDPTAVIIALHGFNDYGHFFNDAGEFLAKQGIVSYAYDQRGFGGSDRPGLWAGVDAYLNDLRTFVQLTQEKHPGLPVYLLGESMGGAVVVAAASKTDFPEVAGLILSAPAVWGRSEMPWYQRWLLAITAHTVPQMHVTGSGLHITPSDNIEMLRALWEDPLIIKETRVDAVYGLANLMDEALQSSAKLSVPVILLYGERDEIIPSNAVTKMLESIQSKEIVTVALYEKGYHMLLRDLEAKTVWTDIAGWIFHPEQPLPSWVDGVISSHIDDRSNPYSGSIQSSM